MSTRRALQSLPPYLSLPRQGNIFIIGKNNIKIYCKIIFLGHFSSIVSECMSLFFVCFELRTIKVNNKDNSNNQISRLKWVKRAMTQKFIRRRLQQ